MFNLISRNLVRPVILACVVFAGANVALAQTPQQTPQSTPRPTPAPNDPTRPPGQPEIPGTTTPAPPARSRRSARPPIRIHGRSMRRRSRFNAPSG